MLTEEQREKIKEDINNMLLTFFPRTILQEAQSAKDIPEIDNGKLTPESVQRLVFYIDKVLESKAKEIEGLRDKTIGNFENQFCNNHQKPIRFLRSVFYDEQDGAEEIESFLSSALDEAIKIIKG